MTGALRRETTVALGMAALLLLAGCGGSSSPAVPVPTSTTPNTVSIAVNLGPQGNYVNGVFTSVEICNPGTTTCQTIPDVLVDTGSIGLRLLASQLTISPPLTKDNSGNSINECSQFEDFFTWGALAQADVHLGGETAFATPIELMADTSAGSPPSACTGTGLAEEDSQAALGANGILGIGVFSDDCGGACAVNQGGGVPPVYFDCPSAGCSATLIPEQDQVTNPVALFAQDNNGVLITLPSLGTTGAATVTGTLTFGIGTQADNTLTSAVTIVAAGDDGTFVTSFNGQTYTGSVLDTGSNGLFILDPASLGISTCTDNTGFYCPSSTANFTATNLGNNGATAAANFSIANADALFNTGNAAFNNLGGPNSGNFDFGLPFFFGRSVYLAIYGAGTVAGPGPYFAY